MESNETEERKTLGKAIKAARADFGMTAQRLADAIGVSKTEMGKIENDDKVFGIQPKLMVKISEALQSPGLLDCYLAQNAVYQKACEISPGPADPTGYTAYQLPDGCYACISADIGNSFIISADLCAIVNHITLAWGEQLDELTVICASDAVDQLIARMDRSDDKYAEHLGALRDHGVEL